MDVVCLGILVADVFLEPVDMLPNAGELKVTDGFVMGAGGCAANVAQCLRRLGRTVAVAGKVGNDRFGDYVADELSHQGIDTAAVRRSQGPTSSTIIINVRGDDRRYLHCIGANRDFTVRDVDETILGDARVLYVGGYLAMPSFERNDLAHVLQQAKGRGVTTVLDVVIPAGANDVAGKVLSVLPWVDYFLPNEDEARVITRLADPEEQARCLAAHNPVGAIVVTRGEKGSVAWHRGQVLHVPPFNVCSIDGSGAGDAFAAGLITGLLENWNVSDALRLASAVGASCTRSLGCIAGVFRFDEAVAFLARHAEDLSRWPLHH
jgi:sugar/nucleoside kinase (ribokinase family)